MKRTKQDYYNLLKETVDYYSEDVGRRGMYGVRCVYYHDGNMCAVGRCLEDPESFQDVYDDKSAACVEGLEKHFKEDYKGYRREFWCMLQSFHDGEDNWDHSGVTHLGQADIESIKNWIEKIIS